MTQSLHQYGADGRPTLRNWREVMKPERLVAMQPNRLSGTRAIVARMVRERWDIRNTRIDVDADGNGTVVYSISTPRKEFSFIAFSFKPKPEGRTGRIIGRTWDMMGTLNEGPATDEDIRAARDRLPLLYRGRATPNALVWCRCNRSLRAFDAAQSALEAGRQPDIEELSAISYLMRNTGLDGNGTFGTRSFPSLGEDHDLGGVLQAQLLLGYLMREFSCDLVSHLAKLHSDTAVELAPEFRRYVGVGNGSALGLIFFIQKHPRLVDSWITARETAVAKALGLNVARDRDTLERLKSLLNRAVRFRREDRMYYESFASSAQVADELSTLLPLLDELADKCTIGGEVPEYPLDALARRCARTFMPESYETFLSLIVELIPDEADALLSGIGGADEYVVDPTMTAGDLTLRLRQEYEWALSMDTTAPGAMEYVWYKSETAEEPRRGARREAPEARDLAIDMPGDLQRLVADLDAVVPDTAMAHFLLAHPQHRLAVARAQALQGRYFHTPHANVNAVDFVPIHLVRLMNSAFHGIDKTRDFLGRNLRGVLFHGAPTRDDIRAGQGADWFYPEEPVQ
ncbi:hypothetical protein MLE19_21335 [Halomonas neptunia]|uniref:Uncharacterized protein n=1 Tax=Vreelandella neptunia TaxID=115551 RepID=A0ABS9SCQ1_9GAMM|nr:hypothetical protein [Halomonas neptunia]